MRWIERLFPSNQRDWIIVPKDKLIEKVTTTVRTRILRIDKGVVNHEEDRLPVEEPLEIAVQNGKTTLPLGVVFRTPGDDDALVLGMLHNEGIIEREEEVLSFRFTQEKGATMPAWRAMVKVVEDVVLDTERHTRAFPITSACGACGKSALESLRIAREGRFHDREGPVLSTDRLKFLVARLFDFGGRFESALKLHVAGRGGVDGEPVASAEDVGLSNAMDKLVGFCLKGNHRDWNDQALFLSGGLTYDLMQKALVCGTAFVVGIGVPSSFAVELANLFNVTLVGFANDEDFKVYSAPHRIHFSD